MTPMLVCRVTATTRPATATVIAMATTNHCVRVSATEVRRMENRGFSFTPRSLPWPPRARGAFTGDYNDPSLVSSVRAVRASLSVTVTPDGRPAWPRPGPRPPGPLLSDASPALPGRYAS